MIVTFLVPSGASPVGGVTTAYALANGLARRGHRLHLLHHAGAGRHIASLEELGWFSFDTRIEHHIVGAHGTADGIPRADVIFVYSEYFPPEFGLPVSLVQGWRMFRPEVEVAVYAAPCPKVCVAQWLVRVGRELGVPEEQLVYVPCGIDHEAFRVVRPVRDRPPQVAMLYHSHAMKGTRYGLEALAAVKERVPELSVVLFGTGDPPPERPTWMQVARLPSRDELVSGIYNRSRIFVCPSVVEGFGITSIEAMACGCALVTSDNGGSEDFAVPGETALVSAPKDVAAMAASVESLLVDDDRRVAIAERGREHVRRFDWDTSARDLEAFLERYLADPAPYLQPTGITPAARQ